MEQAAQLALKARILDFGIQFPKVHDISGLMATLEKLGVDLKDLRREYGETVEDLDMAYISSRYLPFSFSGEDVEKALEFVEKLMGILWKR